MKEKNLSSLQLLHKDLEVIDDVEYLNKMGFRVWYDKGILEGKNGELR